MHGDKIDTLLTFGEVAEMLKISVTDLVITNLANLATRLQPVRIEISPIRQTFRIRGSSVARFIEELRVA
jgi:hypothetical protein